MAFFPWLTLTCCIKSLRCAPNDARHCDPPTAEKQLNQFYHLLNDLLQSLQAVH